MQYVETTGRTVEEAQEAALDQLGVDASEAEFEILEEPKTGLFGRVRGDARVRARIAPKSPRAKQERRPRRQRSEDDGPASGGTERSAQSDAVDRASSGPEGAEVRTGGSSGRRSPSANGGGQGDSTQEGGRMTDEIVPVARQADIIAEFLEGLVEAMGADGSVERHQIDDDTIELRVEGSDLGLLIGPKGQTLTAIHELSRTVLQRRETGRHEGRVRIDIGGYRRRRQEALALFANQQAEAVLAEAKARALEPMNAADRKVVHDTVNDIAGVTTSSQGADPDRCVVILPSEEPEGAEA